jgi:hypothetical protein
MNSLLFGISIAAALSTTSLAIVLLRVSPLTAPLQAIPTLFVSVFLAVSTVGILCFVGIWKVVPHAWDTGTLISISIRQGIFLGSAAVLILLFQVLGLLTWWIFLLIVSVFVLVELALE